MKDNLGDRMKESYENRSKTFLTRKIPVVIRLDAKAFHTFTKGMKKPFDDIIVKTMQQTMKYLCENIQGCVLGYTQSDEITLVLSDYSTPTTDAWFDYNVQKIVSVSASMATLAFNKFFAENIDEYYKNLDGKDIAFKSEKYNNLLLSKVNKALFDSRAFSIPKDEVVNCLIWRQQDATRNSIQSVGQTYFSQKQLNEKTCNEIQDMLFTEKGINWNDLKTTYKRGSCCYKQQVEREVILPKSDKKVKVRRNQWYIDNEIPIFTQDRKYIEKWL